MTASSRLRRAHLLVVVLTAPLLFEGDEVKANPILPSFTAPVADSFSKREYPVAIALRHYNAAVGLHVAGFLNPARLEYLEALKNFNGLYEAYYNLGAIYVMQRSVGKAIAEFEVCLACCHSVGKKQALMCICQLACLNCIAGDHAASLTYVRQAQSLSSYEQYSDQCRGALDNYKDLLTRLNLQDDLVRFNENRKLFESALQANSEGFLKPN